MDTSKVIRGVVNRGRYTVTAPIVKEDYGLYLQIEGVELPSTYQVDFSNSENSGTSVTMIGNSDGVLIPSQFISTGKDVFAFLYHVGADYGRTVYKFRIPNKVRPDRTEETPTPEEQSVIDQAISALNEAVAQTAQDVIDADASAQSASADAERAGEARTDAQNYATQAEQARDDAQTYANNASASATASANSASASAQIKADVEDLVDDAQGYAQASAQSASASANSASQAQGYAQSATASASSAQGYASQAQTSAQTASTKASEASQSATTASQKATEATQSASQASGYAQTAETAKTDAQTAKTQAETARDNAVTAKTAAETAQGKAEDAQAAAESAAESIPSDYSQLSKDVLDLKEGLNYAINNSACVLTFEQGTIALTTGKDAAANNYIRNSGFIPYESIYKIVLPGNGYVVNLFRYYADKTYIAYAQLTDGFGEYVIPYYSDVKWFRLAIKKADRSAITPLENVGIQIYGLSSYRQDQKDEKYYRNFIEANKQSLPIVAACYGTPKGSPSNKTDYGCIAITDLHGKYTSLDDSYTLQQYMLDYYSECGLQILCFGDSFSASAKVNGSMVADYNTFIAKAIAYNVYLTMGQHECGFGSSASGRKKANCLSHTEVFEKFIEPLKDGWGLDDLETVYYYKDFANQKLRLISLYQFNIPLIDDPNDNTCYKYRRDCIWYGQDQIDWLISTLNEVPENYNVIILMHEPEGNVINNINGFYTTEFGVVGGGNRIINGTPIYDIVEAWINKNTINSTYVCTDTNTYPTSDFTLNAVGDFTLSYGELLNYFTGDAHIDYIGTIENTGQNNIGLTSSGESMDFALRNDKGDNRVKSLGNNPESSIVSTIGYNYRQKIIRVGRIGQQFSSFGKIHMLCGFTYGS